MFSTRLKLSKLFLNNVVKFVAQILASTMSRLSAETEINLNRSFPLFSDNNAWQFCLALYRSQLSCDSSTCAFFRQFRRVREGRSSGVGPW